MRKIKSLLYNTLLLAIIGMFSACSTEKENYLSSLPAESSVVFKLNIAQLAKKSNLMDNPMVNGMLMQAEQNLPEALKSQFEEIRKDPSASGLDWQRPLAIAVGLNNLDRTPGAALSNASVVCVAALSDVKKFETLMEGVIESEPSITIIEIDRVKRINLPEDEICLAYNDTRIVMTYGQNLDIVSLVNQKAEESVLARPNFSEFAANEKDCSIFMNYAWMVDVMAEAQKNLNASSSVSPLLMEYLKDMNIYGSLNFETGKVMGDMKVYPSGAAKQYMEEFYMKPTGKFIGLLPADTYLGMNFAVKNYSECLKYMGENEREQIEAMLTQYGLSTETIDLIHGDILIGIYSSNGLIPGIVVAAQCKDRTLFDEVKKLMCANTDGDMFEIPNTDFCVSFADDALFVSSKALYDQCLASGGIKAWNNNWGTTALGQSLKKGGISIDFQAISKNPLLQEMAGNRDGAMTLSILKQIESFILQMESMLETSSELTLMNKDKNALEQIIAIGIGAAMMR